MIKFKNRAQFNLNLDRFGDVDVPEQHLLLQKKVAIDFLTRVVQRNPVGNPSLRSSPPPPGYVGGRSRGNWQVSFSNPNDEETGVIDPSGSTAISSGTATIVGLSQPFSVIWIFNNVPYILRLENGWSQQAPAGMVAVTLAEFS
jgi:hypothetical protein